MLHEHAFLVYDPHSQRACQWIAQANRSPAARAVGNSELRAMLCHSIAFQLLYAQVPVHTDANLCDVLVSLTFASYLMMVFMSCTICC